MAKNGKIKRVKRAKFSELLKEKRKILIK